MKHLLLQYENYSLYVYCCIAINAILRYFVLLFSFVKTKAKHNSVLKFCSSCHRVISFATILLQNADSRAWNTDSSSEERTTRKVNTTRYATPKIQCKFVDVLLRPRSSWMHFFGSGVWQKKKKFENHRKSLIQHCERSELRLHFEWTKVN